MEGKAVLFKRFADIDVFDIEIDAKDPERLIETIAALEPTFGGINLEDIKAPECFIVEKALKMRLAIPVFHDDQHGTAIITAAALLNAVELQRRKLEELQIVCLGAGASAIACMDLWIQLGVRRDNITMIDSRGIVRDGRGGVGPYKAPFARPVDDPRRTLADALRGADVLVGLSSGGTIAAELIEPMAPRPIIFVLANPDPEIPYNLAVKTRPDAIVATGRSDFPNQVNNVLGFPFIFRGALDVAATSINDEMKLAAARALAALAREPVLPQVITAYGGQQIEYGSRYIIPKPFDPRVLSWVSTAVAQAAIETGVAQEPVDLAAYRRSLEIKAGL
jgi:malate dehydrogenase (oxaloacetate-decarboxylating)(NADP+)